MNSSRLRSMFTCDGCNCTDTGWVVFHACPTVDIVTSGFAASSDFTVIRPGDTLEVEIQKDGMVFTNQFGPYDGTPAGQDNLRSQFQSWIGTLLGGAWTFSDALAGSSSAPNVRWVLQGANNVVCPPDSIIGRNTSTGAFEVINGNDLRLASGENIPDDCCETVESGFTCVDDTCSNCDAGTHGCASPGMRLDFTSDLFFGGNTAERAALLDMFNNAMSGFSGSWTDTCQVGYSINGTGSHAGYQLAVTWDWGVSPGPAVIVKVWNPVGQLIVEWDYRGVCNAPYFCDAPYQLSVASPAVDINGNVQGGEALRVLMNTGAFGALEQC